MPDELPCAESSETAVSGTSGQAQGTDAATGGGGPEELLVATLTLLECRALVIIDDSVPDIEVLRPELVSAEAPLAVLAAGIAAIGAWPRDHEERWQIIEAVADQLSFADRRSLTNAIYGELRREAVDWESEIAGPLLALPDRIPGFTILSVSPREWERHGILSREGAGASQSSDIPVEGTCVCLFDFDLSKAPNRRDDEGLLLARRVITDESGSAVYAGVVSRRFNDPAYAERVREDFGPADRDRVVLLSRETLDDGGALAIKLRSLFRAHSAAELREIARERLDCAHREAMTGLASIEVAPLLHAVADLSYIEGIAEFDTVCRFYLIKFRRALEHRQESDGDLQTLMRAIRRVKIPGAEAPPELVDLVHEENYVAIESVNRRFRPIDVGDVFAIRASVGGKLKKYVLVTHSCDLMIRSRGMREVAGGAKETEYGVLLPVTDGSLDGSGNGFEMPHAKQKVGGKRASLYVRFRPAIYVPLFVLDMCVFSGTGDARIAVTSPVPEAVAASVAALHGRLIERTRRIVDMSRRTAAAIEEEARAGHLVVTEGAVSGISGRVEGESVIYECSRVLRLSPPMGASLLAEYAAFVGREASPMALTPTAHG